MPKSTLDVAHRVWWSWIPMISSNETRKRRKEEKAKEKEEESKDKKMK